MAEELTGPDLTSFEIRQLLRRLDPKTTGHKDRVRRLTKFRNYVVSDGKSCPEFYDDDLPLLFLGSDSPEYSPDDEDEFLLDGNLYGLLKACGVRSTEHDNMLKRSSRPTMNLLKFLVCDYVEPGTVPMAGDLNIFAEAFCSIPVSYYTRHMNLELHIIGDPRGGAKEDCCQVMVMLLCYHMAEDGETPECIMLEDLLPTPTARQLFEAWMAQNVTKDVQQLIQKNAAQRIEELALQQRQDQLTKAQLSRITEDDDDDSDESEDERDRFDDEGDVLAGFRRRKKERQKELEEAAQAGDIHALRGPALRWEDSQLYREQKARMAATNRVTTKGPQTHETVRDSQEAAAEAAEREEEKAKVLGRDPLGLMKDDFDLRTVQSNREEIFEMMMNKLNMRIKDEEAHANTDDDEHEQRLRHLQAQKESLESIVVEGMGGFEDAAGEKGGKGRSILPTDPNFDPLVFLTMVHKEATYSELLGSMEKLTNKTENQVMQLQNLVLDNFPLFVRCADGIDLFNEKMSAQDGPGMMQRLDKLEAFAESCTHQARKSFKPLLDNTNEVRKVQSALAVLERVTPILQAPYLMRQHIENGRFPQALKAYRRVLVIDEHCNIVLLNHAKAKAEVRLREARRELENRLAYPQVPVPALLDGIRDLSELCELHIPDDPDEPLFDGAKPAFEGTVVKNPQIGVYDVGGTVIKARDHPPALACLLVQAAHFTLLVSNTIHEAETTTRRIFDGELLMNLNDHSTAAGDRTVATTGEGHKGSDVSIFSEGTSNNNAENKMRNAMNSQWKYDILDARVLETIRAVDLARVWLPRVMAIAKAASEDEKRKAARVGRRSDEDEKKAHLTAFEVVLSNVAPTVTRLVEHVAFCALGSSARSLGREMKLTFGQDAPDKLRALLRSPLPPSQSTRVGKELASLVEILVSSSSTANGLRLETGSSFPVRLSPLDEAKTMGELAVVTIEKRRCIYAFEVCARACTNRAAGSGKFDGTALLNCVQGLADQLSHPGECATEIGKGCELVVRRCCEGLASYVRDRGDPARLRAVAECADVLTTKIPEVIREVGFLTNSGDALEQVIVEDILGLEGAMFDEFLEGVRRNVASVCNVGWLDRESDTQVPQKMNKQSQQSVFPPYLSAALLAIVRCRAQVEPALGNKIRRSEGVLYQHLAMATASSSIVEGICSEVTRRKSKLKVRQADRMANELQFLMNTLKMFLNEETLEMVDQTRRMLCLKAGRGGGIQGDGPDGLAALEDLERLGRVYVLCLGE